MVSEPESYKLKALKLHASSFEGVGAVLRSVVVRDSRLKFGASSSRSNDDYIKRSDLDALFKMLKENGNTYGYSFGASRIAYEDDHLIRELGGEEYEEPTQEANQDEGGVENEGEESIGSDAEEDEVLTIPKGPMTRARARKLKEAIGGLIRKSLEQEEYQDLIISFHHPLNLICYCFNFEKIEFKSSRVDQEAMGSEEDDETFVRRNRLLQEAITKQVMEAMVKLLEEKYDQRPHDGQGQASGSRHEQRRNRQGQREHAGSEETDNFYERSSHSSGSRRS
ncbi:hypothetical protein IGI04_042495, partial [Brassica rapa subsp. trilocularis]